MPDVRARPGHPRASGCPRGSFAPTSRASPAHPDSVLRLSRPELELAAVQPQSIPPRHASTHPARLRGWRMLERCLHQIGGCRMIRESRVVGRVPIEIDPSRRECEMPTFIETKHSTAHFEQDDIILDWVQ